MNTTTPRLTSSRAGSAGAPAFLARVPLFASLGEPELQALAELCRVRRFPPGGMLFHEGDPANALFLIRSGQVKIVRDALDGEEAILHLIGPGECLGEVALLDGGTRSATAVALGRVDALRLDREEFWALLERQPAVARAAMIALAGMVRRTTDQLHHVIQLDVPGRLARTLLTLATRHGRVTSQGVSVGVPLTQAELAQIVGVTRQTVSEQLGRLRKCGVLSVDRGEILLHKPEWLRRRVEQSGLPCPWMEPQVESESGAGADWA
jgi:CRP-like cAMP-binding protein